MPNLSETLYAAGLLICILVPVALVLAWLAGAW